MSNGEFFRLNPTIPSEGIDIEYKGNILGSVGLAKKAIYGGFKYVTVPAVTYSPKGRPDITIPLYTAPGIAILDPQLNNPRVAPDQAKAVFAREQYMYSILQGPKASYPTTGRKVIPETRIEGEYMTQQSIPFSESQETLFALFAELMQDSHLEYLLDKKLLPHKELFTTYILLSSIAASLEALQEFHAVSITTERREIVDIPTHQDLLLHFSNILIDVSRGPDNFQAFLVDLASVELQRIDLSQNPSLPAIYNTPAIREEQLTTISIMQSWLEGARLIFSQLPKEEYWNEPTIKNVANQAFVALHIALKKDFEKEKGQKLTGAKAEAQIEQLEQSTQKSLRRLIVGERINNILIEYGLAPHTAEEIDAIVEQSRTKLFLPEVPTEKLPIIPDGE